MIEILLIRVYNSLKIAKNIFSDFFYYKLTRKIYIIEIQSKINIIMQNKNIKLKNEKIKNEDDVSKNKMNEIFLFEAFSGIGSQYQALKNISSKKCWKIRPVGIIEWYIDAIIAYIAIHYNDIIKNEKNDLPKYISLSKNSKDKISQKVFEKLSNTSHSYYIKKSEEICNNLFDINITKGNDIPKNIDIFTYSFPCQDLSIQGKQRGMEDRDNTRSGLLWQIKRIFWEMKKTIKNEEMPKYLLLENVKNIIGPKHISNFEKWIKELESLGYVTKKYVLNSAHYGSPQNRERVFCISVRKDYQKKVAFEFPYFNEPHQNIKMNSILKKNVDKKFYKSKLEKYKRSPWSETKRNIRKTTLLNYTTFHSESYIYDPEWSGPTLTASGANSRIKILTNNSRIRFMTPLETYLYMGFSKNDYLNVKKTKLLGDNKITYTAGNSISIEILEAIFNTFKFENNNHENY